jgi:hypothetical protein
MSTEEIPGFDIDMPATYRIRVHGHLIGDWIDDMWGGASVNVSPDPSGAGVEMDLLGELRDQAALVGVMNALYNSGYTVLSVERVVLDADITQGDEE